jgi:hypothetical protein
VVGCCEQGNETSREVGNLLNTYPKRSNLMRSFCDVPKAAAHLSVLRFV